MAPSPSATVNAINDFPDHILTHIISFLPTEDAFRTSVLSKRWVPLCYSLVVLRINDDNVYREIHAKKWIHFRKSIDAVMFSPRSQHLTLKSFHLDCQSRHWETQDEFFTFNEWIEAAKWRRIEHLDLYLLCASLAPHTIFCCKTLVVLKLTYISVLTMFRCSVDLPLLKTLDLYSVCFEEMEDFMKLLSGCPLLEDLKTIYIEANTGVTAGGYFKPLPKLIKAFIYSFQVPLRAVYNVKFLIFVELGKRLPNDEINSYYKAFPVFENLTKLELYWFKGIHDWEEIVRMLQNCPKLQTLLIAKGRISKTIEEWNYPHLVPECVSSHLTTCEIINYQAFKADFRFATYILQNARLLQVMEIERTRYPNPTGSPQFVEDLSSCPRISPSCKLSIC